jgi:cell division protein FtsI (penicillin-binding protein 3)
VHCDRTSEIGTGKRAKVEDLDLGVKTGTAQLIDQKTGTYSSTDFVASCMALLPIDEPTLILYHVIIKPKGPSYLGGRIATIPIRDAAEALADYLGIPRSKSAQATHSGTVVVQTPEEVILRDVMPNLTGYSKRQLLPLLQRKDIHVEIQGEGWVKKQEPPPGTPITTGMHIYLELE